MKSDAKTNDNYFTILSVKEGARTTRGRGVIITYGFAKTCLGDVMIGKTEAGAICWVGLKKEGKFDRAKTSMRAFWPKASFVEGDITKDAMFIDSVWCGETTQKKYPIEIYGTPFQISVWRELFNIPFGQTVSYHDVAVAIGKPSASRAVGGAVGSNPLSLLIPCHRVIQKNGCVDNYGWGTERKKELLKIESETLFS
jgi:AraC family transcriptional regulator of adaptative response/methylated-DNA-[protein]-cysteine methyltransferase